MQGKKAAEIFAAIDPQLWVINAGQRHRRKEAEWAETVGVSCLRYGGKVVRVPLDNAKAANTNERRIKR